MLQLVNHLDASYNLAKWLTQNEHDAEDIVQGCVLAGNPTLWKPSRGRRPGLAADDCSQFVLRLHEAQERP